MAPTPPDPHIYKGRWRKVALVVAVIVIIAGLLVVFANKPGAGMGGSLNGPDAQADSR